MPPASSLPAVCEQPDDTAAPGGSPRPRIVSLLPSVTEILFAIGAGAQVVGVTHECDHPPAGVAGLPAVTRSRLAPGLSASEIDTAVADALSDDAHSVYGLDAALLARLRPQLIVTQALCAVCAVPQSTVEAVACKMPTACRVVAADPHTLDELWGAVAAIAAAAGREPEAKAVVAALKQRLQRVRELTAHAAKATATKIETETTTICSTTTTTVSKRPAVVVLEWPDPPYAPGHWVPDQIDAANATVALGVSGQPSRRVAWDELHATPADIVVCAFCGWDLERNKLEIDKMSGHPEWDRFMAGKTLFATDANAYFSRPGVRLVDGAEMLAFLVHRVEQLRPQRGGAAMRTPHGWVDVADL